MRIVLTGLVVALVACSPHADIESGSEGTEGDSAGSSGDAGSASSSSSGGGALPSGTSSGAPDGGDAGGGAGEAKCTKSTKTYGGLGMWECVPTGMETKQATPAGLVVAMHGYTQGVVQASSPGQAWGFKSTSQWQVLAEKHRFYVVYPDKGSAAFQWYAFFGTTGIGRNDLEPSSIRQMVDDMRAKYNIAPDKIFVNGLSAGAYMTVVMLATHPDVFAAGATFAGGAYGCGTSCAALGKKGSGWTWPGNHAPALVTNAHPAVWKDPAAKKPRLMIFQGDADGAVTSENLTDLTQQWKGAVGITSAGTTSTLKGHTLTEYTKDGSVALATVLMKNIGHGTPVDPGSGVDQGGWDPKPSQQAANDPNAVQDWTNSAGIYGPYYAAKFFGLVP
jgi:poly(hydroxyalkanoate) depolymerase family esterase